MWAMYRHGYSGNSEGVEWFKCEHCMYKSKWKNTLKRHFKLKHVDPEDVKWFECEQCPFRFKEKGNLNKHVLRRHTS
ncbi:hypothetical protein BDFB_015244, partial [Asbolus verrucosus]